MNQLNKFEDSYISEEEVKCFIDVKHFLLSALKNRKEIDFGELEDVMDFISEAKTEIQREMGVASDEYRRFVDYLIANGYQKALQDITDKQNSFINKGEIYE
jgi:hypothetical protein